jgi:2'-5' RNA ligase
MNFPLSSLHLAGAVEFDYAVIEAIYPGEVTRDLLEFIQEEIDQEDVFESEEIKGKEDAPHITILYGIREQKPDVPKVGQVLQNHNALNRVKWLGLGKFEAEDHDVLIIEIESEEAAELFRDFNNIYPDNTNSYPDYKAHTTLAYVKKGKADPYIEKFGEAFADPSVAIQWIRFDFNGREVDFDPSTGEVKSEG